MKSLNRFAQVEELLVYLATLLKDDHRTLWALCLTSCAFNRVFNPVLWSEVVWNDHTDAFFLDRRKLDRFLDANRTRLPQIRIMRVLQPEVRTIRLSDEVESELGVVETGLILRKLTGLETYESSGNLHMDTLWTLAKSCPHLKKLIVRGYFGLFKSSGAADNGVFPSLKTAVFHSESNCHATGNWEVCSGIFGRVMLHQAPFMEEIRFCWPKTPNMISDRHAVKEFIFFFVGFLAPTVQTGINKRSSWRLKNLNGWPLALRSMQFCVSDTSGDDAKSCPKCSGRSMANRPPLPSTDDKMAPLLKRMSRTLPMFDCKVWGDEDTFWHVSLSIPERSS